MKKIKKKFHRDNKKKKFVNGTRSETGALKKDKEDQNMKNDHGKKLYKNWSKRNRLTFQNEGEVEDSNLTRKAKDLFRNRRNRRFFPGQEENSYSNNNYDNKTKMNKKGGKQEIKTPKQIFKVILIKIKLVLFY